MSGSCSNKTQLLVLLIYILPYVICELSSCYRARCTHCTVKFVEKMCPSTCGLCQINSKLPYATGPKIRPVRPNYSLNENARVHAATKISSFSKNNLQNKLASYEITKTRNLPPIAQLPNSNTYSQNGYGYQVNTQTPHSYSYQNQLQQYYSQPSQATSFGSSYSVINSNAPIYQAQSQTHDVSQTKKNQQEISYQQPSTITQSQQPYLSPLQQIYGNSVIQNSQVKQSEIYNYYQPPTLVQRTAFVNPFPSLFLPPFQTQTQPVFPTFLPSQTVVPFVSTPQPLNNNNNLAKTSENSKLQPSYVQNNIATFSRQSNYQKQPDIYTNGNHPIQYSYLPKTVNPSFKDLNPKVVSSQINQAESYSRPVLNYQTIQKTTDIPAAPSIDKNPTYINKNAYGEKSGGQYLTCPKQPNWEPCISKEIANKRFYNCCQKLGEGCSQLCSYDQTLATIQIAVITGRCPISKVAEMMICASGYEDATPCCQAHNVFAPGFEHCRPYCNPSAGLPKDGMLAEKYRCLGKLSEIQRCFYVTQKP